MTERKSFWLMAEMLPLKFWEDWKITTTCSLFSLIILLTALYLVGILSGKKIFVRIALLSQMMLTVATLFVIGLQSVAVLTLAVIILYYRKMKEKLSN